MNNFLKPYLSGLVKTHYRSLAHFLTDFIGLTFSSAEIKRWVAVVMFVISFSAVSSPTLICSYDWGLYMETKTVSIYIYSSIDSTLIYSIQMLHFPLLFSIVKCCISPFRFFYHEYFH